LDCSHVRAMLELTKLFLVQGRLEDAKVAISDIQDYKGDKKVTAMVSYEMMMQGQTCMGYMKYAACEICMRAILLLDEKHAMARTILGDVLLGVGNKEEAKTHYQRAYSDDPSVVDGFLRAAQASLERGEYVKAQGFANKTLIFGEVPKAHVILGNVLTRTGKPEEGYQEFKKAKAAGYVSSGLYANMGFYQYQNKKYKTAEKFYEKALELDSNDVSALTGMGFVLLQKGEDLPRTEKVFQHALSINPEKKEIHMGMMQVRQRQGRMDEVATHHAIALGEEEREVAKSKARKQANIIKHDLDSKEQAALAEHGQHMAQMFSKLASS